MIFLSVEEGKTLYGYTVFVVEQEEDTCFCLGSDQECVTCLANSVSREGMPAFVDGTVTLEDVNKAKLVVEYMIDNQLDNGCDDQIQANVMYKRLEEIERHQQNLKDKAGNFLIERGRVVLDKV